MCLFLHTAEPVIQWFYNNQLIKPSKYFQMYTENGVHTLHVAGAFPEDEGVYKCTARNQAGEVTCIAHLKVIGKWVIDTVSVMPRLPRVRTGRSGKWFNVPDMLRCH